MTMDNTDLCLFADARLVSQLVILRGFFAVGTGSFLSTFDWANHLKFMPTAATDHPPSASGQLIKKQIGPGEYRTLTVPFQPFGIVRKHGEMLLLQRFLLHRRLPSFFPVDCLNKTIRLMDRIICGIVPFRQTLFQEFINRLACPIGSGCLLPAQGGFDPPLRPNRTLPVRSCRGKDDICCCIAEQQAKQTSVLCLKNVDRQDPTGARQFRDCHRRCFLLFPFSLRRLPDRDRQQFFFDQQNTPS